MCTVSWFRSVERLELFCNRDEQRRRGEARPPEVRRAESGIEVVSPTDADGGGTWVAANTAGVVLCLLNHYQAGVPRAEQPQSRGLLVSGLAGARSAGEVRARLGELDLDLYRGFLLLCLERRGADPGGFLAEWDARSLALRPEPEVAAPLVSSGYEFEGVARARRATYARLVTDVGGPTPQRLAAFHASREPEPGPYAVEMEREDARTVSHTHVCLAGERLRMTYRPLGPAAAAPVALERALEPAAGS